MKNIKLVFKFSKKYKMAFLNLFICIIVTSSIGILYPYLFGLLIDEVFYNKNMYFFKFIVILYGVLFITEQILHFILNMTWSYLMTRYLSDVKMIVMSKILKLRSRYLKEQRTGDLITIVNTDCEEFVNLIHWNFFYLVANIIRFSIALLFVYFINPLIAFIMIILIPIVFYFSNKFGKKVSKNYEIYRENYGNYISSIFEIIEGIKHIQLMVAERIIKINFLKNWRKIIDIKINLKIIEVFSERINELIIIVSELVIYSIAGLLVIKGKMTLGGFIASLEYFGIGKILLKKVNDANIGIKRSIVSINKIRKVLEENEEYDDFGSKELPENIEEIMFENVSFSYEKENIVLDNVNFTIKKGEKIAIVGKSGVGKTTLINILLGYYQPSKGNILINNVNLMEFKLSSIRKQIGIVHQDIICTEDTIRNTIIEGQNNIEEDKIWQVCKKLHIEKLIKQQSKGLDTILGRENDLSGGQKQRLAIARILLREPQIIIFDEATSALDAEVEKLVKKAWDEEIKGSTSIIIAHRLSTIIDADKVLVIDKGRIRGFDKHENLLKKNKEYIKLFRNQYLEVGV